MRHASFYYVLGFAVAGLLMLAFTVITLAARTLDSWNAGMLALTTILPFVVSMLSWREWGRLQETTASGEED
jgi:hypothetical protein